MGRWGTEFELDRMAALETRMWMAHYRRGRSGSAYWPEVARLLEASYRQLRDDLGAAAPALVSSDRPAGGR
jgi:hypothetical protein